MNSSTSANQMSPKLLSKTWPREHAGSVNRVQACWLQAWGLQLKEGHIDSLSKTAWKIK